MRKTAQDWIDYLTGLCDTQVESPNISWMEGFICGLANAGVITEDEEDILFAWLLTIQK